MIHGAFIRLWSFLDAQHLAFFQYLYTIFNLEPSGLGTEAFRGIQVIHTSSAVNDLVTVMARQRNLVVTVTFQAQAAGSGYGPVDIGSIEAGALAVARAVLTHDTAPAAAG